MSKMSNEEVLKEIEDILEQRKTSETVELSTLKPGDAFMNGRFVVLDRIDNTTRVRDMAEWPNRIFDEVLSDWKKSNLRKHLNTEVLTEYEELFGAKNIPEMETDLTTADGQTTHGACHDKVRLLTFMERRKYQGLYEHSGRWEWTVTPWSTKDRGWEYGVCVVSPSGSIDGHDCDFGRAVRPFVSLKSNIFVSR